MTLEVGFESVARRLLYNERAQPNTTPDRNITFVVEGSEDMLEYRYSTCRQFCFRTQVSCMQRKRSVFVEGGMLR